jgi:hypothetical protein
MRSICNPVSIVALVTGLLVLTAASMASAQLVGPVTIRGKRYINGALETVNCAGKDGNTLDGTFLGERLFTIDQSCPLWVDTGDEDELFFAGREEQVSVNGKPKNILIFSGTEQGSGPALGAVSSEEKISRAGDITGEKGRITYSYSSGENSVIFVGDFKATY